VRVKKDRRGRQRGTCNAPGKDRYGLWDGNVRLKGEGEQKNGGTRRRMGGKTDEGTSRKTKKPKHPGETN